MDLASRGAFIGALVLATVVFFSGALAYGHWSSEGWYEQGIEDFTHSCDRVATALDPSGRVHVVYHAGDYQSNEIRHAVRSGGDWEISTVSSTSEYITSIKMSVGDDSVVRVAWRDAYGIHFASNSEGGFEVASAEIEELWGAALAFDPSGNAHALVTIRHYVEGYPSYALYQYEHWVTSSEGWTLAATYDAPAEFEDQYVRELLIDGQGDLYAFIWFKYNFTTYYYLAGGAVTDSTFELGPSFAYNGNIALVDAEYDSEGRIHLLMRQSSPEPSRLEHWLSDGYNWDEEFIDYAGDSSWPGASLYIDAQDRVYVAYSSYFDAFSSRQCEVAERSDDGWTIRSLRERDPSVLTAPSLVVDSEGVLHVAGFASDGSNTLTMTYASSDGHEVLIDSLGQAALWTALAAVIGWPATFAVRRWLIRRRQERERLEGIGLYPFSGRKGT